MKNISSISLLAVIHYVRLPLILTSGLLVATTSIVMLGKIEWQPVCIVMLGTYVVYTIDNLIDWAKESHLLKHLETVHKRYRYASWFGIPAALAILTFLSLTNSLVFFLALGTIYGISLLIIITARLTKLFLQQTLYYWIERLIVALSWAGVTVFVPLRFSDEPFDTIALLTLVYLWQIAWIIGVVWRYSSVMSLFLVNDSLSEQRINQEVNRTKTLVIILQIICFTALIQAIVDIALGFFPIYNSIVLIIPILQFLFLCQWNNVYKKPLAYCNTFLTMMNIGMFLIILIYYLFD